MLGRTKAVSSGTQTEPLGYTWPHTDLQQGCANAIIESWNWAAGEDTDHFIGSLNPLLSMKSLWNTIH